MEGSKKVQKPRQSAKPETQHRSHPAPENAGSGGLLQILISYKLNPLKMNYFHIIITLLLPVTAVHANILEVGTGKPYSSVAEAAAEAVAGDTILVFPGTYSGSNFITELHGTEQNYIYILGERNADVIFQGGSLGMQLSKVSYVHIENFRFTGHTGNSLNIDDGGADEATRSRHIRIVNCHFYDMGASGNNDFLKMSGVDHFEVYQCSFLNGAAGGSGIDMVGCHNGLIYGNMFENMGSNSIQAKGGTQYISIFQNFFINGGQRTLNLGGSTGLEFFRPQDATFEAADLDIYANIITGSTAPVAYVGCVRVNVVNNTIIHPGNWVIRILQETVDPQRFEACGNNSFVNNIIYFNNSLSTFVNIGPDTAPATFTFSHNLWYNHITPANSVPSLPVAETSPVIGQDPLFESIADEDFNLKAESPAINAGLLTDFSVDFNGLPVPAGGAMDIGALEFTGFLPVHLTGPEATYKEGVVFIRWKTDSEFNNDFFTVEKSPNGIDWTAIERIKGQGTTTKINQYLSKDLNPSAGHNLYRIKQTDFDGLFTYSKIISVNTGINKKEHVFPNPFESIITLETNGTDPESICLLNSSGSPVPVTIESENGIFSIRPLNSNLPPGVYFLISGSDSFKVLKH